MKLKGNFFWIESVEDEVSLPNYKIRLNPAHTIFKVHFPGNPIVPGVCQIELITEILEEYTGKRLSLAEVKNIKFLAVLTPVETERLSVTFKKLDAEKSHLKASAVLSSGTKLFAKINLLYKYDRI